MKRDRQEEYDSEEGSSDEESDVENLLAPNEEEEEEEVDIEFEFFDPVPEDVFSIRNLLSHGDGFWTPVIPDLAEIVANQANVGTVVKCEDEDSSDPSDAVGFVTALNLKEHGSSSFVDLLKKRLKKHKGKTDKVEALLDSSTCGLIVCERIANFPAQLIPSIWSALLEDIDWAGKEAQEPWRFLFKNYIIVAKVEDSSLIPVDPKSKKQKQEQILFVHPEMEIFLDYASTQLKFSTKGRDDIDNTFVLMTLSASDMEKIPNQCLASLESDE